jgi:hypothetical protein
VNLIKNLNSLINLLNLKTLFFRIFRNKKSKNQTKIHLLKKRKIVGLTPIAEMTPASKIKVPVETALLIGLDNSEKNKFNLLMIIEI